MSEVTIGMSRDEARSWLSGVNASDDGGYEAGYNQGWKDASAINAEEDPAPPTGSTQDDLDAAGVRSVLHLIGWKDGYTRNAKDLKKFIFNESLQIGFEYLPGKKGCHVNVEEPAKVESDRSKIPRNQTMAQACDLFIANNQHLIKKKDDD